MPRQGRAAGVGSGREPALAQLFGQSTGAKLTIRSAVMARMA
jgi:hypothetical protein